MNRILISIILILLSLTSYSQKEENTYKVVGGLRVFPFFITDFNGFSDEYVRINLELGLVSNQKVYYSIGYTPISKTLYTFEEYWINGLDKKNPVALVGALDYNLEPNNFVYSFGFGFQKGFANAKILLSSDVKEFYPYLRIGVIFPLNWEIYKKE